MSILIKGMEMPKDKEIILRIDEKGEVYIYGSYPTELYSAVELPPHGRLIDADALAEKIQYECKWSGVYTKATCRELELAPTIIEAETCNNSSETCNKDEDAPVNASKWVLKTFDDGYGEYQLYVCDKCGERVVHRTSYCPNCGARMVEE